VYQGMPVYGGMAIAGLVSKYFFNQEVSNK
jgi:hypothetical protein